MTVADLFNSFITNTGRLDITSTRFISICNEACELLASMESSKNILFRYVYAIDSETSIYQLPDRFRSVESVRVHYDDTFTEYSQVVDISVRSAIDYGFEPIFSFMPTIISGVSAGSLPDSTYADAGVSTSEATPGKALVLYPAAPPDSFLEIESKSFVSSLLLTTSSNYWTDRYPWLLLEAINYVLIKDLLNFEESGKILKDVEAKLKFISFDSYENENITQMGG